MQVCWLTALRCVSLKPIEKGRATGQTARHDITTERFGFHDCDVRFTGNGHEIVGSITAQWASRSKMKWYRNLVHGFAIQLYRPDATTHESPHFNRATQAHQTNVIAIADL